MPEHHKTNMQSVGSPENHNGTKQSCSKFQKSTIGTEEKRTDPKSHGKLNPPLEQIQVTLQ